MPTSPDLKGSPPSADTEKHSDVKTDATEQSEDKNFKAEVEKYWRENPITAEDHPLEAAPEQPAQTQTSATITPPIEDFPITRRERNYWRTIAGTGAGIGFGSVGLNIWWWLSTPAGAGSAGAGIAASTTVAAVATIGTVGVGLIVGGYFAYKAYKDFWQQAEELNKSIHQEKIEREKDQEDLIKRQIDFVKNLIELRKKCKDLQEFTKICKPETIYKDIKATIDASKENTQTKQKQWEDYVSQFTALTTIISVNPAITPDEVREQFQNFATALPKPPTLKDKQVIEKEVITSPEIRSKANHAFRNYALGSFAALFGTTYGIAGAITGFTLAFSIPVVGWCLGLIAVSALAAYGLGRLAERYTIKNAQRKIQLKDLLDKKAQLNKMQLNTASATGHIKDQITKQANLEIKSLEKKIQSIQSQLIASKSHANENKNSIADKHGSMGLEIDVKTQNKPPSIQAPHSPETDATIASQIGVIAESPQNRPNSPSFDRSAPTEPSPDSKKNKNSP